MLQLFGSLSLVAEERVRYKAMTRKRDRSGSLVTHGSDKRSHLLETVLCVCSTSLSFYIALLVSIRREDLLLTGYVPEEVKVVPIYHYMYTEHRQADYAMSV